MSLLLAAYSRNILDPWSILVISSSFGWNIARQCQNNESQEGTLFHLRCSSNISAGKRIVFSLCILLNNSFFHQGRATRDLKHHSCNSTFIIYCLALLTAILGCHTQISIMQVIHDIRRGLLLPWESYCKRKMDFSGLLILSFSFYVLFEILVLLLILSDRNCFIITPF